MLSVLLVDFEIVKAFFSSFLFVCFFNIKSHYVRAGIKGMCHYAQLINVILFVLFCF